MKVDLSGIFSEEITKTRGEYEAALSAGDSSTASEKATYMSDLLMKMAENNPSQRDHYLNAAKKWDAVSKSIPSISKNAVKKRDEGLNSPEISSSSENMSERGEFRTRAESCLTRTSVVWNDIGGLFRVKQLLMETVVIAGLKRPSSVKPWKGVLLFGPPGTGKTLLASAAAGSLGASFYDVKSENILSKYFGESSKLISALYDSAKEKAPSIIFFDEFDSLTKNRSENTSEASAKLLSGILTNMDGLSDKKNDRFVLTLAATNTPWELDKAVLSRFPRRIYVSLPDSKAIREIIKIHTSDPGTERVNLDKIAEISVLNRYSGRDVQSLCQQAIWNMIHEKNPELFRLAELPFEELNRRSLKVRPLEDADFKAAFDKIKSPVTEDDLEAYDSWNIEFGEV